MDIRYGNIQIINTREHYFYASKVLIIENVPVEVALNSNSIYSLVGVKLRLAIGESCISEYRLMVENLVMMIEFLKHNPEDVSNLNTIYSFTSDAIFAHNLDSLKICCF